jgi:hypothetical protein
MLIQLKTASNYSVEKVTGTYLKVLCRHSLGHTEEYQQRADESVARMPQMARGKISVECGINYCPTFFLFPDQLLHILKNMCA